MSTNFLVKKPSTGLSVSVTKKDLNGKVLSDKICTGLGYVECTLNRADEVIELRLIEKVRKPVPMLEAQDVAKKVSKDLLAANAKVVQANKDFEKVVEGAGKTIPMKDVSKTVPMKDVAMPKVVPGPAKAAVNPAVKGDKV